MVGSGALWRTLMCCLSIFGGALQQSTYVRSYRESTCRYHLIRSANAHKWLPGLASVGNVSLSVECQSEPHQALVSWSNGGLPWLTLTVEYYCTNSSNTTTEMESSVLHPIIPTLDTPLSIATDSTTVNISEDLGTECSFLGCFEGDEPYLWTRFTFSTQTCRWKTETVPGTSTPSRAVAYSTVKPFTPSATQLTASSVTTTARGTEHEPQWSLSYQQSVWLVVATVLTAALATLLAVVSCFLVRKKIRRKTTLPMFPDWHKDKIDPNFHPVRVSNLYIDLDATSIQSHHDPLERLKEPTSLQLPISKGEPTDQELDPPFTSNVVYTIDSGVVMESWMDLSCSGSGLKSSIVGSCSLEPGQLDLGACTATKSMDKSALSPPNGIHMDEKLNRYNVNREYVVVDDSVDQYSFTSTCNEQ